MTDTTTAAAEPAAEPDTDAVVEVEVLPAVAELPQQPTSHLPDQIVGLPGVGEIHTMELVARQISATDMVPRAYRNRPDAILACFLAGRELRIPPMQSLRDIDIVEGKPAPSAKLVRELILRNGHQIRRVTDLNDTSKAVYKYRRRDWPAGEWATATYTIEMAEQAGLCKRDGDGIPRAKDSKGNAKPWEKYPAAMLRHRCMTTIGREDFPDCLGTMIYTAEELMDGDGVDADGRLLPDSPATDERSPAHVRWDLALEQMPEATVEYCRAQFNEANGGTAFAFVDLGTQETWAAWAEGILEKVRAKQREQELTAAGVDPEQPHEFTADALGACKWCGGDEGNDLHAAEAEVVADGDVEPQPATDGAQQDQPSPDELVACAECHHSHKRGSDCLNDCEDCRFDAGAAYADLYRLMIAEFGDAATKQAHAAATELLPAGSSFEACWQAADNDQRTAAVESLRAAIFAARAEPPAIPDEPVDDDTPPGPPPKVAALLEALGQVSDPVKAMAEYRELSVGMVVAALRQGHLPPDVVRTLEVARPGGERGTVIKALPIPPSLPPEDEPAPASPSPQESVASVAEPVRAPDLNEDPRTDLIARMQHAQGTAADVGDPLLSRVNMRITLLGDPTDVDLADLRKAVEQIEAMVSSATAGTLHSSG